MNKYVKQNDFDTQSVVSQENAQTRQGLSMFRNVLAFLVDR